MFLSNKTFNDNEPIYIQIEKYIKGIIDKNLLAFTGNLESHNDAELIIQFLNKYGIKYINLNDGALVDIGGIIPLTQIR